MQNAININITVLFFIKTPFCYSACPIFQKQSKLPYLFLPIMFSCLLFFIYISLFKKYCHIYGFPHTYDSISLRTPAYLSGKLLNSCRLLRLVQTIHTSAASCCFYRITCYFFQNCSCNIFLFVTWHIIHLQFHFSIKVYLILHFILFKC